MNDTLDAWLKKLEERHFQEIQLGLERIQQIAAKLELLTFPGIVISVGGTNGKGSTVALLESIYLTAGYSVGSYTSPHLLQFTERIKVNKEPINDETLIAAFDMIETIRGTVPLTYFETVTLVALWYFKQSSLDIIILEVGLGGRLDATNILDTDLSIITTVDRDHESYLGNTLEKIGFEKAGIMRENKPCIYADLAPPQSVIDHAFNINNQLLINNRDYACHATETNLEITYLNQKIAVLKPNFHDNSIAAAIMTILLLREKLPVSDDLLQIGLNNTLFKGRLQRVKSAIPTLIDVAHNPQSATYLASYLKLNKPKGKIHAVFSALTDKNIVDIIRPLKDDVDNWYLALLAGKRAATKEQLLQAMHENGLLSTPHAEVVVELASNEIVETLCYNDPIYAYQAACKQANSDDLIVVFGSFLTAASILSLIGET